MSRYRGAKLKIIRRLGELPGLTNKSTTRTVKAGHQRNKIYKKNTEYCLRLEEKQKLKFNYGLTENQLHNYIKKARQQEGNTGLILLQFLEMRLDTICFSLGFAPTMGSARQLVNHGHITVNNQKVDIPSFQCKKNDKISFHNEISKTLVKNNLITNTFKKLPTHLELNQTNDYAKINDFCCRESVLLSLNELIVIEYYSRK
jgi:small subunit ribosomal protein S4